MDFIIPGWKQAWPTVAEGEFGASMSVELINEGPVTLIVDRDADEETP